MKSLFYAALLLGSAAFVACSAPQQCTWGGLGFNPYDRWNVFSFNDIGSAVTPFGSDFQGRGAAVGNIWVSAFTFNVIGDNSYPFAATAGGTFTHLGGDVVNGGIQAAGKVVVKNIHVQGDIISTDDTIQLGGTTSGESVTGTGAARAKFWFQYGTGSSMAGGIFPNTNGLSLDVDLLLAKAFFQAESAHYYSLANTVTTASYSGGLNGDLIIPVAAGLNVLTIPGNGITATQFKNAARLLIKGPLNARLVINVDGTTHALDTLDVSQHISANVWGNAPTFGRLLLNFHQATSLTMVSPSYFTLLAPFANLEYTSGVITGNVIVNNLFDPDGSGAQVNFLPWVPDCPDQEIPPAPPSPQDTGNIPSPPEECPLCPWDEALGFNPWEFYNIFSLGSIGTPAVPCGADYQGRLGAINSVWVKAFSVHDIYQGVGPQFSASVGGNFNLFGGSVHNGGIEAGGNVYLESANVDGSVVALGDAVIGVPGKAVTVSGAVSAGGNLAWAVGQSSAGGGFFDHASPLSVTAPLAAIGQYFKDTAGAYAALANTLVVGIGYSFVPDAVNPNDILVTLQAGVNVISISSSQLQKASRLLLSGDLSGVLIINVAGASVTFDSLDVYVDGPNWTLHPSFGQVIVNLYAATSVSVPWGSGQWSLLAPYADVTYTSGLWTGNWVVGNLLCAPWGGSQLNAGHWSPPCPECVVIDKSKIRTQIAPPDKSKIAARPPRDGDDGPDWRTTAPPDGDDHRMAPPDDGDDKRVAPPNDDGDDRRVAPPDDDGNDQRVAPPDDGDDKRAAPPNDDGDDKRVAPPNDDGDDRRVAPPDDDGNDQRVAPPDDGDDRRAAPPNDDGDDRRVAPPDDGDDERVAPPNDDGDDRRVAPPDDDGDDQRVAPPDDGDDKRVAPPDDDAHDHRMTHDHQTQIAPPDKSKIATRPPRDGDDGPDWRMTAPPDGDDHRMTRDHATQKQKTAAQSATAVRADRHQQQTIVVELPSWVMPVGVFVCGVALAALVVAGVAFVQLSKFKRQRSREGEFAMSPRYPTSP